MGNEKKDVCAKMILSERKAQVAFDYLILLTFVLGLVIAVSILITYLTTVAQEAVTEAGNMQASVLSSLMH